VSDAPPPEAAGAGGWRAVLGKHRRRLAGVLLLVLVVLLVTHGSTVLPTTLQLILPLSDAAHVTEVDVALLGEDGSDAYHLHQRFDGDAPDALSVQAEVPPGRYDVHLRVERAGATAELVGDVEAPADGEIRVHLRAAE
jgi:hypothetical protein